ncbi:DJ-1/PfpI family protein [Streptomonospora sp. PA3]|uniref:DJ-1/PfpI family protein n=1 Tax=Streptomonospora sp. PA3 TaxID=2607326 RepID=UPI0012DE3C5B|nr:DJ-1/PfpI family protein [Streptomonospora sp. PA3]MUL41712.1 DJ-1/PfpI family protein [Streptomonospora sp. PA3]
MHTAILLFDGYTALDAVGPYEILSRLPEAEVSFVAERPGAVRNDSGSLALVADAAMDDVSAPDILLVPGGPGQAEHMQDAAMLEWIRAADAASTWTASVCTGSLLLAAAGLLDGRRATSHWLALDRLPAYGARPTGERVVFDGKYVTAAGVSSGIDMALHLTGRVAGDEFAQIIQLATEYDPQPPYDAGAPQKAPGDVADLLRSRSEAVLTGRG